MSNIVKKCRKDGLVYAATYAGQCEQCFAELGFYCKVHNAWLTSERCEKCDGPSPIPAPAAATPPPSPRSKGDLWLVLFFIGCVVVLAGSVTVIWRIVSRRNQPITRTSVAQPVIPPAPQPVAPPVTKTPPPQSQPKPPLLVVAPVKQPPPPPRTSPPLELSLSQIFADPDLYIGKVVRTRGAIQSKDTTKESFDLRLGNLALQVQYAALTAGMKTLVAAETIGHEVTITGTLQRDEELNAVYIVARQIDP